MIEAEQDGPDAVAERTRRWQRPTFGLKGKVDEWQEALHDAWQSRNVGAGTSVSWPVGIGGKGNEGVANYVQQQKNSIGYVEFAYAKQNSLTHTVLKNHAGTFVEPSFESFEDAAATASFDPTKHFYLWLNDAPGKKAWPIAGATFILLAKEKKDSNMKVVKFYDWAFNLHRGAEIADDTHLGREWIICGSARTPPASRPTRKSRGARCGDSWKTGCSRSRRTTGRTLPAPRSGAG